MGRAELPRYRDALSEAKDWVSMMDAAMGMGAVALRHSGAKVEVSILNSCIASSETWLL